MLETTGIRDEKDVPDEQEAGSLQTCHKSGWSMIYQYGKVIKDYVTTGNNGGEKCHLNQKSETANI